MTLIPVVRSGMLAQDFCRTTTRATVEAVFARSFYLRCGDAFVCVGEPDIGNGPLTLIAQRGALRNMRPRQSAQVSAGQIVIGGAIRLVLDRSETWRAPPWPLRPAPDRLIATCAALARRAAVDAPDEGLARLVCGGGETAQQAFARVARLRVARFERWLSGRLAGDAQGAANDAIGLLGLGPGLTPSGDDFLVGALATLDATGECDAHAALARAIIAALPAATSPLSACFLRAAAAGHAGESLHRAVWAVMAGDAGVAIAAVDTIGHSSGWDMLAGVIATLRVAATARAAYAVA